MNKVKLNKMKIKNKYKILRRFIKSKGRRKSQEDTVERVN